MKKKGYCLGIAVSISSFHIGYVEGAFSISAHEVLDYYNQRGNEDLQIAILNTLIPFFALFGSLFGYCCIDRGRRSTIICSHIFIALASILSLIPLYEMVYLGRIINGFFTGYLFLVIPQYLYQIAPLQARSIFLTFHQIMMSVGNLTAFLVSLPLLYQKHVLLFAVDSRWWNVVFALPVASSCFILLLFTYIYPLDSPLYYYFIQDQRSFKKSLSYMFRDQQLDREIERIFDEQCKSTSRVQPCKAYCTSYFIKAIVAISGKFSSNSQYSWHLRSSLEAIS